MYQCISTFMSYVRQRRTFLKILRNVAIAAIAVVVLMFSSPVAAANLANGVKLFNANCSACHVGGSNVIIANKTLKKEALEKYSMNSLEAIKNQIKNGKSAMPAFGGRFNDEQIEDVATYVLEQSQKGW